jgi:3',5'-cyclic-AMP phosphodiesterase
MEEFVMKEPIRILQLTDLHLFSDKQTTLLGFNPYQSLLKVINKVSNAETKKYPDLLALTGDISQDYSLASYEIAAEIFSNLLYPITAIMGNHDYPSMFTKIFGDPLQNTNKSFSIGNWRIIFLNSHWSQHVGGQLATEEFTFLKQALDDSINQHVIIFLHHQVLPIESTWIDRIMLSNATQLLEIIDQYKNIKAIFCGHVHQETLTTRLNVNYYSTPATCWQFENKSDNFKLATLMPGYRTIDLFADGSFETKVERIDYDATLIPDLKSTGY